jgi:hypothetical protein
MWTLAISLVVLLHAAYLVFQTLGALLTLRHRGWLWAHLVAVTWGVTIVAVQGRCPLTLLEKYLITRSGAEPYTGSYLDHYVFGQVIPNGAQPVVYGAHLVVIVATYVIVLTRRSRPLSPAASASGDEPTEHRLPDRPKAGPA